MTERKLLKPKEVMAILRFGKTKVYEMIKSGVIKSIKVNNRYRIDERDLLLYLNKQKKRK